VGSRSRRENLAYIAGFLDGDGSLMLQVKKRKDGKMGWRFMFTVCFYQDTRHSRPLAWIRKELGIGYLSNRNDGITESRINGFDQVKRILELLKPYIRFKKIQTEMMIKAARILSGKKSNLLRESEIREIADAIVKIRNENYQSGKKDKKSETEKILGLTPYRLSPKGRYPVSAG